jgi:hypothetical protein
MPKDPRKFQFSFEKTGLTRFGGLGLFQSFCKYLCLRRLPWVYALPRVATRAKDSDQQPDQLCNKFRFLSLRKS